MLRNQDITVVRNDSLHVQWSVTDVSGPDSDGPTNLLGRSVAFRVYKSSRNRNGNPLVELDDTDPQLRIDDPEGGVVSLHIGEDESTINHQSGRYYLTVHDDETVADSTDQWTVATGAYTLTR